MNYELPYDLKFTVKESINGDLWIAEVNNVQEHLLSPKWVNWSKISDIEPIVPNAVRKSLSIIEQWLNDNCKDEFNLLPVSGTIHFKSFSDALLFKLKWGA